MSKVKIQAKTKSSKPKAKTNSKRIVSGITWDWKDTLELSDLSEALKPFHIRVYNDIFCEGSDQYGFILSNHIVDG